MADHKIKATYTYFVEDPLATCEEKYQEALDFMAEVLMGVSPPPDPAAANGQNLNVAPQHPTAHLPRINLPTFEGAFEHWESFRDRFISMVIDNQSLSNVERLHFLHASLKGEASLARGFRGILLKAAHPLRESPSAPIDEYQLLTVTYGTTPAPYLALRVLRQLIEDEGSCYPDAVQVLSYQAYVDDFFFGSDDLTSLRLIRNQTILLLQKGGFSLRKWASNDSRLLSDIDEANHGLAVNDSTDHQEQELYEQAAQLGMMEEYNLWEHRLGDYLNSLEERSRIKRLRLSIGEKQSLIARIARLESLKDSTRNRFVHVGAGHSARLRWHEIDTAFVNRILTGAVINSNHIEPRNFLEDARDIVVDHVRNIVLKHDSVKINAILNGEFVAGNKCANKSVNTKNCELFRLSDLREWYDLRVIEPILASLDEFQERDSGWALSRILNLIVNVNKYMPMHAGCVIQLPREIRLKKAVINVCSTDNACFAWSVVAALYPAESHVSLASSYPHYTTVLNIQDIEFPMTLNQIKKFVHINNISINVYTIENKKVLPIRVTDKKMERHVNLLYLEGANDVGHFAWIQNLSRLVCTQLSKHNGRKYFCDRCLHYFSSNEKLEAHTMDFCAR
ncbi:uncharacterized protein LOC143350233 [Colletes latitarsis]|uniref:uncharacterized protein LOC143350233 n=1 Tax=Colletes latitarsis TaxID=2605962 RepID=UPI00403517BF